jgi:hypothetical protein
MTDDELIEAWKRGELRVVPPEEIDPEQHQRLMDALDQLEESRE